MCHVTYIALLTKSVLSELRFMPQKMNTGCDVNILLCDIFFLQICILIVVYAINIYMHYVDTIRYSFVSVVNRCKLLVAPVWERNSCGFTFMTGAYPGGWTPGGPSESLILAPTELKNIALIPLHPPLNMTCCETRHYNFVIVNMSEIFIQTTCSNLDARSRNNNKFT